MLGQWPKSCVYGFRNSRSDQSWSASCSGLNLPTPRRSPAWRAGCQCWCSNTPVGGAPETTDPSAHNREDDTRTLVRRVLMTAGNRCGRPAHPPGHLSGHWAGEPRTEACCRWRDDRGQRPRPPDCENRPPSSRGHGPTSPKTSDPNHETGFTGQHRCDEAPMPGLGR